MFKRWVGGKKSISRASVIKGFELYFGRTPESEEVIVAHMKLKNEHQLVKILKSSHEYSLKKAQLKEKLLGSSSKKLVDLTEKIKRTLVKNNIKNPSRLIEGNSERLNSTYYASSTLNIVIFGNCQSLEIAKLMQAMTGGITAVPIETTRDVINQIKTGQFQVVELINTSDLIFVQEVGEILTLIQQQFPDHFHKVRRFPCFNFSAYHPDLVYVSSKKNGMPIGGLTGHYQSALVLAGWLEGFSVEETLSLFRDDVFKALGYYDYWNSAKKMLLDAGERCDFSLVDLFDKWSRQGCWMYSVNHPKKFVLADIARKLLTREHIETIFGAEDFVIDGLAKGPVWPVYPEIGEHLGINGHYLYKSVEGLCPSEKPVLMLALEEFISESYALFEGFGKEDLSCERLKLPVFKDLRRFWDLQSSVEISLDPSIQRQSVIDKKPSTKGGPYMGLPAYQFWRRAIERVPFEKVDPVVCTSFKLSHNDRIATAGSCFAQHISSSLSQHGFNYFITERNDSISKEEATHRHYGLFTARYGNIYSTRQLLQLFDRAYGFFNPADGHWLRSDGKWVDAFRPQLEPDGFASLEDLEMSRAEHFRAVREMFEGLDVMVFTLGLTEVWRSRIDGAVYPIAPGVVAGEFDETRYEFVNLSVHEVIEDLQLFIERLRGINAKAKMILTVSPVPLVATYENRHVLVSTTLSKSLLRTAADQFVRNTAMVDYFPSYEIITGHYNYGKYYEQDLRSINTEGVQHVMRLFLSYYGESTDSSLDDALVKEFIKVGNIICDEDAIDNEK